MKIFLYILILTLSLSCMQNSDNKNNISKNKITKISLDDFTLQKHLKGERINIDNKTKFSSILTIDTLLILKTASVHKEFLKVYSLNNFKHLGDIGTRGEAPGELRYADINHFLSKKNDEYFIWISDRFKGYLKQINISKSLAINSNVPTYSQEIGVSAMDFPFNSIFYSNDKLYGDIGYEDDSRSRFKIKNLKNGNILHKELYPTIKNQELFPSPLLYNFYVSDFRMHPSQNKFVSALKKMNRIDYLDSDLNLMYSVVDGENWDDDYFDASEIDFETTDLFKLTDGYTATAVSEDYIFTNWRYDLKLDETEVVDESIVKVFDWEGVPVALLYLDSMVFSSSYNEKSKKLFVSDLENEQIMVYDLKNIL